MNTNILNRAFSADQSHLSIRCVEEEQHREMMKSLREKHHRDYEEFAEHAMSAEVINERLGNVERVLSKQFEAQWREVKEDPERLKIFEAISAWPEKLIALFFQKIYAARGPVEKEEIFVLSLLQSTYQEVEALLEEYRKTNDCLMAFQGENTQAIDDIFKAFSVSKEEAINCLSEDLGEICVLLELALHETVLKEAPFFIQYLEKLPEFRSEKSLMASLEQYQTQIQDPERFGERITAAQISFFIHAHKEKLLPAFISYDILEKTKRGSWPNALVLRALAKRKNRHLYFWRPDVLGRLEWVRSSHSLLQMSEDDVHLLCLDGRKFSILDYSAIVEAAALELKPTRHLFRFYAPNAEHIYLAGDFNNWLDLSQGEIKMDSAWLMQKNELGLWTLDASLIPGRHEFQYVIDGEKWERDPDRVYGISANMNSVCHIPRSDGLLNLNEPLGPREEGLSGRSRANSRAFLELAELAAEHKHPELPSQQALESLTFEAARAGQYEILGLLLGHQLTPEESLIERISVLKKENASLEAISFEAENAFNASTKLKARLDDIEKKFSFLTNPAEDVRKAWEMAEREELQSIDSRLNQDLSLTTSQIAVIKEQAKNTLHQYWEEKKEEFFKIAQAEVLPMLEMTPAAASAFISHEEAKKEFLALQLLKEKVGESAERLNDELLRAIPKDAELIQKELNEHEAKLHALFLGKAEYLKHLESQRRKGFLSEFQIPIQLLGNGEDNEKERIRREALIRELRVSPDSIQNGQNLLTIAINAYFDPCHFRLFQAYQFPQDFSGIEFKDKTYVANVFWQRGCKLEFYYYLKNTFYKIDMHAVQPFLSADFMTAAKQDRSARVEISEGASFISLRNNMQRYHKGRFIEVVQLLIQSGACLSAENEESRKAIARAARDSDRIPIEVIKLEMGQQTRLLAARVERYQLSPLLPQIGKLLEAQDVITWYGKLLEMRQSFSWLRLFITRVGANLKTRAESVALLTVYLRLAMSQQNPYLLVQLTEQLFERLAREGYRVKGELQDKMLSILNALKASGMTPAEFLVELQRCQQNSAYSVRQVALSGVSSSGAGRSRASLFSSGERPSANTNPIGQQRFLGEEPEESVSNNNNL